MPSGAPARQHIDNIPRYSPVSKWFSQYQLARLEAVMKIRRRAVLRAMLGLAVVLSGTAVSAAPASAIPFVVCDSWPAPSISASGGIFTAHYYHKCNTISGVQEMYGQIFIRRDDGDGNRGNDTTVKSSFVAGPLPQGEAAGTLQWPVGGNHGHYYAREQLIFRGDFTSGPAPHGGCGRDPAGSEWITCEWYSASIFG
jgi:hypothetical protein